MQVHNTGGGGDREPPNDAVSSQENNPLGDGYHPPSIIRPPQKLRPVRCNGNGSTSKGSYMDVEKVVLTKRGSRGVNSCGQNCGSDGCVSSLSPGARKSSEHEQPPNKKRKRKGTRRMRKKMESFAESLMKRVMEKQDQMHREFMEMLEKIDEVRIMREHAWKQQDIERAMRNEQERAQAMSRSKALLSFLESLMNREVQVPKPLEETPCLEKEDHDQVNLTNCSKKQAEIKHNRGNNEEVFKYDTTNTLEGLLERDKGSADGRYLK